LYLLAILQFSSNIVSWSGDLKGLQVPELKNYTVSVLVVSTNLNSISKSHVKLNVLVVDELSFPLKLADFRILRVIRQAFQINHLWLEDALLVPVSLIMFELA
jgi:hypothetical protein